MKRIAPSGSAPDINVEGLCKMVKNWDPSTLSKCPVKVLKKGDPETAKAYFQAMLDLSRDLRRQQFTSIARWIGPSLKGHLSRLRFTAMIRGLLALCYEKPRAHFHRESLLEDFFVPFRQYDFKWLTSRLTLTELFGLMVPRVSDYNEWLPHLQKLDELSATVYDCDVFLEQILQELPLNEALSLRNDCKHLKARLDDMAPVIESLPQRPPSPLDKHLAYQERCFRGDFCHRARLKVLKADKTLPDTLADDVEKLRKGVRRSIRDIDESIAKTLGRNPMQLAEVKQMSLSNLEVSCAALQKKSKLENYALDIARALVYSNLSEEAKVDRLNTLISRFDLAFSKISGDLLRNLSFDNFCVVMQAVPESMAADFLYELACPNDCINLSKTDASNLANASLDQERFTSKTRQKMAHWLLLAPTQFKLTPPKAYWETFISSLSDTELRKFLIDVSDISALNLQTLSDLNSREAFQVIAHDEFLQISQAHDAFYSCPLFSVAPIAQTRVNLALQGTPVHVLHTEIQNLRN